MWLVRGNKNIITSSHVAHVPRSSASVASVVLCRIWPWFNLCLAWVGSGTSVGPDPNATLAHICHSRRGRRLLSEARPDTQY